MKGRAIQYLLIFLAVFFVDRLTKWYAIRSWCSEYVVTPFFSFVVTLNRGISWGLLSSEHTLYFIGISSLIIAVTAALAISAYRRYIQGRSIYGETLVVAGSCSNIVDRIVCGGVIDFILVHARGLFFPVFNLADCFVVVGVCIMAKELWDIRA